MAVPPKQPGVAVPTLRPQGPASAVPLGSRGWGHATRLPGAVAVPRTLPPGAPGLVGLQALTSLGWGLVAGVGGSGFRGRRRGRASSGRGRAGG